VRLDLHLLRSPSEGEEGPMQEEAERRVRGIPVRRSFTR